MTVAGVHNRRRRRGSYLKLLLLEHVGPGGVEDVISQLGLAVYVDGRGGFAGQEAVVDLAGPLGELGGVERRGEKGDR